MDCSFSEKAGKETPRTVAVKPSSLEGVVARWARVKTYGIDLLNNTNRLASPPVSMLDGAVKQLLDLLR